MKRRELVCKVGLRSAAGVGLGAGGADRAPPRAQVRRGGQHEALLRLGGRGQRAGRGLGAHTAAHRARCAVRDLEARLCRRRRRRRLRRVLQHAPDQVRARPCLRSTGQRPAPKSSPNAERVWSSTMEGSDLTSQAKRPPLAPLRWAACLAGCRVAACTPQRMPYSDTLTRPPPAAAWSPVRLRQAPEPHRWARRRGSPERGARRPRRRMLREADSMVTRARMFEHKPDGDVNIFMLQARGATPCGVARRPTGLGHLWRRGGRGGRRTASFACEEPDRLAGGAVLVGWRSRQQGVLSAESPRPALWHRGGSTSGGVLRAAGRAGRAGGAVPGPAPLPARHQVPDAGCAAGVVPAA